MMNETQLSKGLKMKSSHLLLGLAGVGLTLTLVGCEGSATQTTRDDSLHGTLVDAAGNPLPQVEVSAYLARTSGSPTGNQAAGRTFTDAHGHYSFAELDANTYNLFAKQVKGSKGLFIPEVVYAASELDLGTDTLLAPGSIAGQVFVDDEPASEIFCYIPGSPLAAVTDSSGRCMLPNIPPGVYALKYTGHDVESRIDSGIIVQSNQVTELEPVSLFYDSRLQPAVMRGLTAELVDTQLTWIRLKWNKAASLDVKRHSLMIRYFTLVDTLNPVAEGEMIPEAVYGQTGTILSDTEFVYYGTRHQFDSWGAFNGLDSGIIEYSIKAIDSNGNSSPRYSNPVRIRIVKQPWMKTEAQLSSFQEKKDSITCSDTLSIIASYSNPYATYGYTSWKVDPFPIKNLELGYYLKTPSSDVQPKSSDTLLWSDSRAWEYKGWGNPDSTPHSVSDTLIITANIITALPPGSYQPQPTNEAMPPHTYLRRQIVVARNEQGCAEIVYQNYDTIGAY